MKQKSPASGKRQGLVDDLRKSDPSTKSSNLTNSGSNRKTLKQIAQKWASRGYHPTPSDVMHVLPGGASRGY